jgi:hypothetical protein
LQVLDDLTIALLSPALCCWALDPRARGQTTFLVT